MCVWLRVHRKVVGDVYIIQPMWNKNQTSFYYFRWSRRRRCCCRLVAERVYFLGWVWPSQGEIMGSIFIYICEKIYEKSLSLRQSRFERMSLDLEGKKKNKILFFCSRSYSSWEQKENEKNLVGFVRVGRQIRKGVFFFFSLWLGREMRYTGTLWHSPAQPFFFFFFFLGIFCLHLRLFWPTHPQ